MPVVQYRVGDRGHSKPIIRLCPDAVCVCGTYNRVSPNKELATTAA